MEAVLSKIPPSMLVILTASLVVLSVVALLYEYSWRLYRRKYFHYVALAWLLNACYILVEALGSFAADTFRATVISYIASLPSTLLFYLAWSEIRTSAGKKRISDFFFVFSCVLISAAVIFTLAFEFGADSGRFLLLVTPGLVSTLVVILGLAYELWRLDAENILLLLQGATATQPLAAVRDSSSQDLQLDYILLTSAKVSVDAKPMLIAAKYMFVMSFGIYGGMQLLYLVRPSMSWSGFSIPFFVALLLKSLNGAGILYLLLADFRQSREAIRQKTLTEELGAVTAAVEHEVRGPLSIMQKNIEALARLVYHNDSAVIETNSLLDQVKRIRAAVDIIPMLRESPNDYAASEQIINIVSLCGEARKVIRTNFVDREPFVDIDDANQHILVRGYKTRLLHVLVNIMNNSVESYPVTAKGADLYVGVKFASMGDRVCVYISDHGSGIDNKFLPAVKLPMVSSKSDGSPNRGLGLYVADFIVGRHNGLLNISSDGRTGTTVTVELARATRRKK